MKSILLASVSTVAFTGAAMAGAHSSLTWSGDVTLGINREDENGIYWGVDLDVAAESALDNGLVAWFSANGNLSNDGSNDDDDEEDGDDLEDDENEDTYDERDFRFSDFEIGLRSGDTSLKFGDVQTAAADMEGTGSGLENDMFDDNEDGTPDDLEDNDGILRFDTVVGAVAFGASTFVDVGANDEGDADIGGLQAAATFTGDMFSGGVAWQAEDNGKGSSSAIWIDTNLGGADATLSLAQSDSGSSYGVDVSVPAGAATVGFYYAVNDGALQDDQYGVSVDWMSGPVSLSAFWDQGAGNEDMGLEGSYDLGNGGTVRAGILMDDDGDGQATYVALHQEIGPDANILLSFADASSFGDDISSEEYNNGATAEVSFGY